MIPTPHTSASRNVPSFLGWLVMILGVSALAGWTFDIALLKSVFPGLVPMKANTALGLILCGGALAILSAQERRKPIQWLTSGMAVGVIVLSLSTLSEYLFGWDLGIDQLIFHDSSKITELSMPGRMAPATAFCFVLTGFALLTATRTPTMRLRWPVLTALGVAVMVFSGLALVGYVTDALFGSCDRGTIPACR